MCVLKTKERNGIIIGSATIDLKSDVDKGKLLDTRVAVNGSLLCWIAGCDIEKFLDDFRALVTKHSI